MPTLHPLQYLQTRSIDISAGALFLPAILALAVLPAQAGVQSPDHDPAAMPSESIRLSPWTQEQPSPTAGHTVHWGAAMDEFLSTALNEDPSIARARAGIAAAENGITAAKWRFGPSPSVSRELASGTNRYVNVVRIQQPLYTGGLLSAQLSAARTTLQSSQLELLAAQRQLKLKIVQSWADWVKATGRVHSLEALSDVHEQLLDMIRRRHQAGVATSTDAALASSRMSAVQAELAQARLEEGLQRDRLRRLALRPVDPTLRDALDGALPSPPTLIELMDRVATSPEMAMARAGVDLARDELAQAKAALMPTVSLRFDHQSGAYHDQRVGLVFQASLQGGLANVAGINAARSRIVAAEAAVAAAEQDQISNYQLEYTRYAAAGAALRNATTTTAASEDVLASYRRQFDAGKRAWLDLLNMVRETHAVRQARRDAAIDERASRYRLALLIDDKSPRD